ncbi:MAG: ATP-binding protein, partial [bacterium]
MLLFLAEPSSQALETLVFNHLSKLYPDEVSYLRENLEVDFLVPEKLLVQVSYTLKDPSTRQRELKALSTAREKYNTDNILIITMNEEEVLDEGIRVVPVWKWVLEG